MPRPLRFAPAGVPLHIRIRGNQRQDVFYDDADRRNYVDLLVRHCEERQVGILGYCLMTNHVHLILQPSLDTGLSEAMSRINSEHAQKVQFRQRRTGHLWHGRFKATAMDALYLWTALRYVELNPVRAGLVSQPEDWYWSSAGAHLGVAHWPDWLDGRAWGYEFDATRWSSLLSEPVHREEAARIRRSTREDRPLANHETVARWEAQYGVQLAARPNGRPRKSPGTEARSLIELEQSVGA